MCGIAGYFGVPQSDFHPSETLRAMANAIAHRGPDDAGYWSDTSMEIGLGHRRLAIVDLSPQGHQPMHSASGRYVIVFNGEIYNYCKIKHELEVAGQAPAWCGHSDTEVILAAVEAWGLQAAVQRFIGMFAIALWDRATATLSLVRDRMGEKPLYYGWAGKVFLFGSELKALRAHPGWRGEINRDALALYMRHNYIPAPHSIYHNFYKLLPGHILTLPFNNRVTRPETQPYWTVEEAIISGREKSLENECDAVSKLEALLLDSIGQQMVADVPLGAFLSGGIDSTTVVALMQSLASRPVKTFTIGFEEQGYNEAEHARVVAQHLGTEHTELYVSPDQAIRVIHELPRLYDEPFADSSQIPTFLVAQLARQHVTVSLSGDAGDELFSGYNRYLWADSVWKKIGKFPVGLRHLAASGLRALSPSQWDTIFAATQAMLPPRLQQRMAGDKMHKLAGILDVASAEQVYKNLVSHWHQPEQLVLGATEPQTALTSARNWQVASDLIQRMMHIDMLSYLPDDILVKVDRASMGMSLESRVPFLDHRVVEFAWKVPLSMKIRNGQGKWVLRQVLYKYVPKQMMERPKMGFGIPLDAWLRGPLHDWAESLLNEHEIRESGFLDPIAIREKWQEHLSGKRNWQYHLWDVLMFQAWLKTQ